MAQGVLWVGIIANVFLLLFATLNLALRVPSRTRLAEAFERFGCADRFEPFVAVRPQYMLATALLRTAATLTVVVSVMYTAGALWEAAGTMRNVLALAVALLLVLVFGVAIPNAWAKYAGETLIVRTLTLLGLIRIVFMPFIACLEAFDPFVRRLTGVPVRDAKSYADELEQEILDVVSEGEKHGAVDEEEKEMIESVIELTDTCVEEIMTPRTEMAAVPADADIEAIRAVVKDRGHSRIPVFENTIDTILGVLYVKDLFLRDPDASFDMSAEMRPVTFIPESKAVRDLLREFQSRKVHIAIVLDEYGGTAGLVTIEDILEELVGDIDDEYDAIAPVEIEKIDDNTVEMDARMRIDDLNDQLKLQLPEDEDFETIGGMVFSRLGRIPAKGEHWEDGNIAIDIVEAEPRRITRVRLTISNGSPGDANGT